MRSLPELEKAYGLSLQAEQKHLLRLYLKLLLKWNERISLTSLSRVEEILRFHFFESFWAAQVFLQENQRVADIGTGAGFPGLAMKLYRPSLQVTLIEKSLKKVIFLKEVRRALNLSAEVYHGAGEDYPHWDRVDVASARALKLSSELLNLPGSHGFQLLLLHGRDFDLRSGDFELLRQEKVPHSQGRYASLLSPAARS
ncbi:MAG: 16S rRNA (guanine(527)-N(7))-methyltransferase RsmG [Acidobacteriota bacterium]